MCIQYNSYKIEFALCGAGHNFIFLESDETEKNVANNGDDENEDKNR